MDNEERTKSEQTNTEAADETMEGSVEETTEEASEALTGNGPSRSKATRVLAVICLVIMAALLVWFVICLVTGSSYTLAVLFLLILYPVILYLLIWLKKVFSR